ncbi:GNAT family N-acetyltransferase [Bacillus suaedaesalsae]|uniref:GNAT family N-acetyltransferase n=1 Tax=Bacillus suaedaesalsae TaxID=2810349 RepID=A0ABS2DHR1_9BACI|nr:GNAT family N-acetyltransferase [Bacillus suaedaesalsae]MBM6618010.1 GNAT family N-acetyltransferase [Bacillus suaedaesalsae]
MCQFRFSPRMERIITLSDKISYPNPVEPVHLFIGATIEGTGVCGELYLYLTRVLGSNFTSNILGAKNDGKEKESYLINGAKFSTDTLEIFKKAQEEMFRYNQIYINEGHLLATLMQHYNIPFITEEMKEDILSLTSVPRDLTVRLSDFNQNDVQDSKVEIRRVKKEDYDSLCQFVLSEFGTRWIGAVNNGFKYETEIPIIIAKLNGGIIGFSCYDVVRNKKGLFGPMGTSRNGRSNGIGRMLLHQSLHNMKLLGYEYAVIGQAGPIEFYEKNCDAKLIPVSIRKGYTDEQFN